MAKRSNLNWNVRRAKRRGVRIVVPTARQLQIDLDSYEAVLVHAGQMSLLRRRSTLTKGWRKTIHRSESRGHFHITITMPKPLNVFKRIALQALLGSDMKREMMNWMRAERRQRLPILLFERSHGTPKKRRGKTDEVSNVRTRLRQEGNDTRFD